MGKPLTIREKQILVLLGKGKLKKEIAPMLQISKHTTSTYTRRAFDKLGAYNAVSAVVLALISGDISLNEFKECTAEESYSKLNQVG